MRVSKKYEVNPHFIHISIRNRNQISDSTRGSGTLSFKEVYIDHFIISLFYFSKNSFKPKVKK